MDQQASGPSNAASSMGMNPTAQDFTPNNNDNNYDSGIEDVYFVQDPNSVFRPIFQPGSTDPMTTFSGIIDQDRLTAVEQGIDALRYNEEAHQDVLARHGASIARHTHGLVVLEEQIDVLRYELHRLRQQHAELIRLVYASAKGEIDSAQLASEAEKLIA
ncbi:hypothetical protein OQA88_8459 [Cercophora sp. LCS_1]